MIIRLYETTETTLVKERFSAPGELGGGEFGTINLLMFTSIELRQRFGLTVAETDFATAFELVRSLGSMGERETDAAIKKSRLARLLEARGRLLPCFIAYQETPQGKILPMMTDGPEGRWSLFFAEGGMMCLAEFANGHWRITPQAELLPETPQNANPIAETTSFLLNGLRSARQKLVRPDPRR